MLRQLTGKHYFHVIRVSHKCVDELVVGKDPLVYHRKRIRVCISYVDIRMMSSCIHPTHVLGKESQAHKHMPDQQSSKADMMMGLLAPLGFEPGCLFFSEPSCSTCKHAWVWHPLGSWPNPSQVTDQAQTFAKRCAQIRIMCFSLTRPFACQDCL